MFLLILFSLFHLINSQEKFCINCRHFKGDYLSSNKFGKCKLFPEKEDNQIEYLVSGKPHSRYYYCSTARKFDNMCGLEGKYYDKKCSIFNVKKINK